MPRSFRFLQKGLRCLVFNYVDETVKKREESKSESTRGRSKEIFILRMYELTLHESLLALVILDHEDVDFVLDILDETPKTPEEMDFLLSRLDLDSLNARLDEIETLDEVQNVFFELRRMIYDRHRRFHRDSSIGRFLVSLIEKFRLGAFSTLVSCFHHFEELKEKLRNFEYKLKIPPHELDSFTEFKRLKREKEMPRAFRFLQKAYDAWSAESQDFEKARKFGVHSLYSSGRRTPEPSDDEEVLPPNSGQALQESIPRKPIRLEPQNLAAFISFALLDNSRALSHANYYTNAAAAAWEARRQAQESKNPAASALSTLSLSDLLQRRGRLHESLDCLLKLASESCFLFPQLQEKALLRCSRFLRCRPSLQLHRDTEESGTSPSRRACSLFFRKENSDVSRPESEATNSKQRLTFTFLALQKATQLKFPVHEIFEKPSNQVAFELSYLLRAQRSLKSYPVRRCKALFELHGNLKESGLRDMAKTSAFSALRVVAEREEEIPERMSERILKNVEVIKNKGNWRKRLAEFICSDSRRNELQGEALLEFAEDYASKGDLLNTFILARRVFYSLRRKGLPSTQSQKLRGLLLLSRITTEHKMKIQSLGLICRGLCFAESQKMIEMRTAYFVELARWMYLFHEPARGLVLLTEMEKSFDFLDDYYSGEARLLMIRCMLSLRTRDDEEYFRTILRKLERIGRVGVRPIHRKEAYLIASLVSHRLGRYEERERFAKRFCQIKV